MATLPVVCRVSCHLIMSFSADVIAIAYGLDATVTKLAAIPVTSTPVDTRRCQSFVFFTASRRGKRR